MSNSPEATSVPKSNSVQTTTMRPRSLYTYHNYYPANDQNIQYYDQSDYWNSSPSLFGNLPLYCWRHASSHLYYPPQPSTTTAATLTEEFNNENPQADYDQGDIARDSAITGANSAIATNHGTILLRLNHRVRVDITIDQAIRVINFQSNIVMAMSSNGSSCALLHPNGRVHQYGSRVEIIAHDHRGNHKYAKMWYKGVSFTADNCALVYLVDSAGTRTTTDNFSDLMSLDFSMGVFYGESRHGPSAVADAVNALQAAQFWTGDDNHDNWIICGVRVMQSPDGLVRITRSQNKYQMRTSPVNGTANITTPLFHCTASLGQTQHLFIRRGERRMHYDGSSFIVRNAGHSAGFDEKTQLKVY